MSAGYRPDPMDPHYVDVVEDDVPAFPELPISSAEVSFFDPAGRVFPEKPGLIIDASLAFFDAAKIGDKLYTAPQMRAFAHAAVAKAGVPQLLAGLAEALEFVEAQEDSRDGPDGEPQPNRAMQLAETLRAIVAKAGGAS